MDEMSGTLIISGLHDSLSLSLSPTNNLSLIILLLPSGMSWDNTAVDLISKTLFSVCGDFCLLLLSLSVLSCHYTIL